MKVMGVDLDGKPMAKHRHHCTESINTVLVATSP